MALPTPRLVLRDLPLATRAVLAVFLVAVGIGYLSALVQLSAQHAKSFGSLPTAADAQEVYAGKVGVSPLERVLAQPVRAATPAEEQFNRSHMSPAFTVQSAGWHAAVAGGREQQVRDGREAERLALLDWVRSGRDKAAYDADSYSPSEALKERLKQENLKLPNDYLARGPGRSAIERLMARDGAHLPFTGRGTMRPAMFEKSTDFKRAVRGAPKELEEQLRLEREAECEALAAFARAGAPEEAYHDDDFALPPELANLPFTKSLLVNDDAKPAEPHHVHIKTLIELRCITCHQSGSSKGSLADYNHVAFYSQPEEHSKTGPVLTPERVQIRSLIQDRCVRCHQDAVGADDRARKIPLDSYDAVCAYCEPETKPTISWTALVQSTHAHLLSFAMLFTLTGLVFSFSGLPGWVKFFIAPLPLVAQVLEIGCWWLSRWYPEATMGILIGGGVVGASLAAQIGLSLLSMFFGRRSLTNGNGNGGTA
jgi:hypothetical protein